MTLQMYDNVGIVANIIILFLHYVMENVVAIKNFMRLLIDL